MENTVEKKTFKEKVSNFTTKAKAWESRHPFATGFGCIAIAYGVGALVGSTVIAPMLDGETKLILGDTIIDEEAIEVDEVEAE